MKIRLLSAITSAVMICSLGTCYADTYFKVENGMYILEGSGELYKGNVMSVLVTHSDEETKESITDHASYITTDAEGNFKYSFALPEDTPSAIYKVELFAVGEGNVYTDTFSHADAEKKQEIIAGLNGEKTPADALSEAVMYSMVTYPENNTDDWPEGWQKQKKDLVYSQIENTEFTLDNYIEKIAEIYAVAMLEYAKSDEIQDVIDNNMDRFKFDKLGDYYSYYTKNKSDVNSIISANTITNIDDVQKVFKKAVVLDQINKTASPNGIVDIINKNEDLFDEKITDLNSDKMLVLAGNIIDSCDDGDKMETMDDIVDLIPEEKKTNSSVSAGRGSSGGGGGGTAIIPSATAEEVTPSKIISFADINDAEWARDAIESLVKAKVLNGYENGDFKPNNLITREEFVKIITLAFGVQTTNDPSGFSDIEAGHWAEKYIASAKKKGIVSGISETEFGLGANITRQDMAVMLANAAYGKENVISDRESNFIDKEEIADYAKNAVGMLNAEKVINGYEDGSFMPSGNATRAEAAQMIYKLLSTRS